MSKRSGSGELPPNKRRHTESDAVERLLSNSDELIKCLQALSNSKDPLHQGKALKDLGGLSKTLLPSFKRLADEENEDSPPLKEERPDGPQQQTIPPIPQFAVFKPWTSAEIPSSLPPLPKITNPVLEKAAFTHNGMVKYKGDLSYDRLEWLGDAYVELISSCLIFQTFGGLSTGRCSQMRELLIRNANLGEYSAKYGLLERATLPQEYDPRSQIAIKANRNEVKKVRGDLFEAYVAAVILSDPVHGLSRATEWLRALWSQTIKEQIQSADRKPELRVVKELGSTSEQSEESKIPPKVQLANAIGCKGINLRYEDIPSSNKKDKHNPKLTLFTVGLYMDGWGERNKLLGTGSDLNKKEAGQKAAAMALNNKKMMKVYEDKKKALQAALGDLEE